ncbi:MAG TPA: hypothetical protein VIR15_12905 [Intrasporangium sp.]|jgi:hypothetical protein|uniref:hypothetical protein n=1 Tax=Intrasporangium sp. TaxID=1925024 RepID=UPI002F957217
MTSFTPLLFIALLYLALEIRHRRSADGPRWRPGEDLRSDRDEARRGAELAAIARPSTAPAQSGSPTAPHRVARKTGGTPKHPMPTVVS